jgi:hypothetical protein
MFRRILSPMCLALLMITGISGSSRAYNHPNPETNITLAVATFSPDDPGIFLDEGPYGTGWHHFSTDDDQVFTYRPGERHFYIFAFGVTEAGKAVHMGNDIIPTFDANLDKVCFANTQTSDGSYAVSTSVVWHGEPGHTGSSADVTFFSIDAAMNFSELGTFAIDHWVRKKGEKMRGSRWQDRFVPVQGCR